MEVVIKIRFLIFIFIFDVFLFGCKKSDDCLINFYASGVVTNQTGIPVAGVEVYDVTHYDYSSKVSETDTNGKFTHFMGSYSDLGNSHITFKKSGYKDVVTPSIGKGSGVCGDQQIIRDAVMEAQ